MDQLIAHVQKNKKTYKRSCGLFRIFCLFTYSDRCKCASSQKNSIATWSKVWQAAWLDTKSCCKIACAVTESHWRDNSPNHMLWAKWSDALSASLLFLDHMIYFLSQISLYTILVAEAKPFCYFSNVLKSDLFDRCGQSLWRHYLYAWFQTKLVLEVDLGLLCTNNIGGN